MVLHILYYIYSIQFAVAVIAITVFLGLVQLLKTVSRIIVHNYNITSEKIHSMFFSFRQQDFILVKSGSQANH